jgi:hypothetical protein
VFDFHIKCDSYVDADHSQWVYLTISDASQLEEKVVEEVIPEEDEGILLLCVPDIESEEEEESASDNESGETDTDTDTDSE